MKQVFKVLFQVCVSCADPSSKMAAIGSDFLKQLSSLQPLEGVWKNLKGRKSSTSSAKDVLSCGSVNQYGRSGPWLFEAFWISLQLLIGFNGRQNLKGNPAHNSNNYPIRKHWCRCSRFRATRASCFSMRSTYWDLFGPILDPILNQYSQWT